MYEMSFLSNEIVSKYVKLLADYIPDWLIDEISKEPENLEVLDYEKFSLIMDSICNNTYAHEYAWCMPFYNQKLELIEDITGDKVMEVLEVFNKDIVDFKIHFNIDFKDLTKDMLYNFNDENIRNIINCVSQELCRSFVNYLTTTILNFLLKDTKNE